MKRLIGLAIFVFAFLFSGCSCNMACFDFDYKFTNAYVYEMGEWKEYNIKKWSSVEGTDMICIWTENGEMIETHSTNIILKNKGE